MVIGTHTIVYAKDAGKARAFFKKVLGLRSADAGRGWLIFALPPGEIAAHPIHEAGDNGRCELYLMCDDINRTVAAMKKKGVKFLGPPQDHGWGILAMLQVPGAGKIGLYEPRHASPILRKARRSAGAKRRAAR